MPTGSLGAFAAVSVVLVAIPGPSVAFTISRALSYGRRVALLNVVGNTMGLVAQVLVVAAGLGVVIERSAQVFEGIEPTGAAYLVWLGIGALRHRRSLADALGLPAEPIGAWRALVQTPPTRRGRRQARLQQWPMSSCSSSSSWSSWTAPSTTGQCGPWWRATPSRPRRRRPQGGRPRRPEPRPRRAPGVVRGDPAAPLPTCFVSGVWSCDRLHVRCIGGIAKPAPPRDAGTTREPCRRGRPLRHGDTGPPETLNLPQSTAPGGVTPSSRTSREAIASVRADRGVRLSSSPAG